MVPPNFSGQYWLLVQANSDQGVLEANPTNNSAFSLHPINISRPPNPNLQVTSVTAPPNAFAGQQTVVYWVLTNAGTMATGAAEWKDAVYLSPDAQWDGSDTFLGAVPNPSYLDVSNAYQSSATINIPRRIQGLYYIIIRTDYQNRVNEGGLEGDNTGVSLAVPITLPPPPDLQVASVIAPYDAFSGQPVTITWAVTNAGGGATEEAYWEDAIYLSAGSNLTANAVALGGFAHNGALASGQFYTNSQQVTLPVGISGTNYYFLVQTDYRNHAWEWVFENNNFGTATHATEIHLTPPPDLEVISVSIPSNICAGYDLTANYRVANNGANDTPNYSWQDAIYLSADTNFDAQVDAYVGSASHYGQLLRTNFYDATANVRLPQNISGSRYVIAFADSQNAVFELDKTNNHRASVFPVNILPLADLHVAGVTVPASALSGFDFSVNYSVTNTATCPTIGSSWSDAFYLSADQTLNTAGDTLLGSVARSGQLAGASDYSNSVTLRLPIGLTGNYFLFVVTDSQGKVPEQNEGNNASIAPIPLNLHLPSNDLEVALLSAPTNALSGFNLTLTCVVTNNGANAVPNTSWRDGFYLSTDQTLSTNDIYLVEVTNALSLAAGGSYTNTLTVRLTNGLSGDFYLFAYADSGTQVFEQNETNNLALQPISIASIPPDLVVESCQATPGTYIAGTSIPVSWTVRNLGPGQTSVDSWSDRVVLSRDSVLGNADDTPSPRSFTAAA